MCYESLERVIGINHKCWKHGKIKGTKAPLPLSTSEMALSLPQGLEHARPKAPPDHFSSTPSKSSCYESLERVIGINHKCWKHGKIKGTKAPLPLSTSEMALSLPKGLEHARPKAPPDHFSSTPSKSSCYESLERVIGINHKCWKHGKIKGTKAPLPLSTSEMALSLPKGLEHARPKAPPEHFSSTPNKSNLANC